MIRNKLAEIMQEKSMKVVRLAKETGISRNTITSTAQNDSEMLRMDTINKICNVLDISPCDFFEYEPIEIDFNISHDDEAIYMYQAISRDGRVEDAELSLDVIIDFTIDKKIISFDATFVDLPQTMISTNAMFDSKIVYQLKIDETDDLNLLNDTIANFSGGMRATLYKKMTNEIKNHLVKYMEATNMTFFTMDMYGFDVRFDSVIKETEIEVISDIFTKY